MYQPTQEDVTKNAIGVGVDFLEGWANTAVGDFVGTVAGAGTTTLTSFTGPAAPVIGTTVGVAVGGTVSAGLQYLENPYRSAIVNGIYGGYQAIQPAYQAAVNFTSDNIMPIAVPAYQATVNAANSVTSAVANSYQAAVNFTSSHIIGPILGEP